MATLLNTTSVYEIRVRSILNTTDQEFDQIWNFIYTNPGSPPVTIKTTLDLLTAFRVEFRAQFLAQVNPDYSVSRYELREILGSTNVAGPPVHNKLTYRDFVFLDGTVADVGLRAVDNDYLPPYASVSLESRVDLVGREFFGVHRIGPVLEIDQADGTLSPAAVTAWTAALGFGFTPVTLNPGPPAEAMHPVLFRKTSYLKLNPALLISPSSYAIPWDRVSVAPRLGTQVSRKMKIRQFGN